MDLSTSRSWSLQRRIEHNHQILMLNAKVWFHPTSDPHRYVYEEKGCVGGSVGGSTFTQKYNYVIQSNGDIHVLRDDDSMFFVFNPKILGSDQTYVHYCLDDTYDIKITLINEGEFMISYSIVGPYKDYSIQNRYTIRNN